MGVAAALKLSSTANVILVEGVEKETASKDATKIIRTQYLDSEIVELAQEAKRRWKTELPFRNFYHPPGWIQVLSDYDSKTAMINSADRLIEVGEYL